MAEWLALFNIAMEILGRAEENMGSKIDWAIGGGTMLHDMYAHRASKDIDIFVSDPQSLLFLMPRSNDAAEQIGDAGSYVEV